MRYVLLLRGINVGGKNKVVMADLKADLAELGFQNPVSYISIVATLFLTAKTGRRRSRKF